MRAACLEPTDLISCAGSRLLSALDRFGRALECAVENLSPLRIGRKSAGIACEIFNDEALEELIEFRPCLPGLCESILTCKRTGQDSISET